MALRNYLLAAAVCCASFGIRAQELSALGGALQGDHHGEHTFTWEIDYQQRLGEFLAFSGGWINQGHLTGHHRDGATAQVWARTDAFNRQPTLAAGIGMKATPTRNGVAACSRSSGSAAN